MGKNEICWAVFSGRVMLPFSIRTTKSQCINDYLYWRDIPSNGVLPEFYTCRKVVINEFKKV